MSSNQEKFETEIVNFNFSIKSVMKQKTGILVLYEQNWTEMVFLLSLTPLPVDRDGAEEHGGS